MYIYNLTTLVAHSIAAEWLQWILTEVIPTFDKSTIIAEQRLFRLLDQDESEGLTYVWQVSTNTESDLLKFLNELEPAVRQESRQRWQDRALEFSTKMQHVN